MNHVLIICIGNICRSPIAEALLAVAVQKKHPEVVVSSAGLGALVGRPADPMSQELMTARGIDISAHRARQISPELVFNSDLILTMSTEQTRQLEQHYPGACGRVHRLGKWGEYDIPDPFKRPKTAFEQAFILIEQGINEWHRKLWM
ncbi:MAG: low molecular weight phosphotyrosine protein phosphatase [Legionellaceae bacterium]|jgi:protein-tyrosine phosphatase|nr:low molecular weight phosphotyrosine protein phosphatase [Legionellaceae bacterium]